MKIMMTFRGGFKKVLAKNDFHINYLSYRTTIIILTRPLPVTSTLFRFIKQASRNRFSVPTSHSSIISTLNSEDIRLDW